MDALTSAEFWIALGQIIVIDITLGADNAIVIALACRNLPPPLRAKGILWGTVGAIVLRVVLIFFALSLLHLPWVKALGAALLLWVGVKVILPMGHESHEDLKASDKLWGAVRTVIVADFVMSLDNVIGIAGAAHGAGPASSMALVIFGLLFSMPLIVWGSQWVIRLMARFPIIITLGGMLLGWIAGDLAVEDAAFSPWRDRVGPWAGWAGPAGAVLVLAAARLVGWLRPPAGSTTEG
jgi:YjbE family integral membrane protein